jgi:hypothetical protein
LKIVNGASNWTKNPAKIEIFLKISSIAALGGPKTAWISSQRATGTDLEYQQGCKPFENSKLPFPAHSLSRFRARRLACSKIFSAVFAAAGCGAGAAGAGGASPGAV